MLVKRVIRSRQINLLQILKVEDSISSSVTGECIIAVVSALFLKQQSPLCSQIAFAELTASYEIMFELDLNLHLTYSWQQNLSSKAVSGQIVSVFT